LTTEQYTNALAAEFIRIEEQGTVIEQNCVPDIPDLN